MTMLVSSRALPLPLINLLAPFFDRRFHLRGFLFGQRAESTIQDGLTLGLTNYPELVDEVCRLGKLRGR